MRYRFFLLIMLFAYWAVGYYPFQLTGPFTLSRGEITRSVDNGFVFPKRSIATAGSDVKWLSEAISQSRLNIQFSAQPHTIEPPGLARLFAISINEDYRNLIIGQKLENLVIYVRTSDQQPEGDVYVIPRIFARNEKIDINIDLDPDRIKIDLDGEERLTAQLAQNFMDSWNLDYTFALGNEINYAFPWEGELSPVRITVGENKYEYTFDDLKTKGGYQTGLSLLHYKLKDSISFRDWRQNVKADWVVNFLGFIPFGFFLVILRKRTTTFLAGVILCGLFSLSIESGQFFIENRTPQLIDLFLNTVGGGVGVWMGAWVRHLGWARMPH